MQLSTYGIVASATSRRLRASGGNKWTRTPTKLLMWFSSLFPRHLRASGGNKWTRTPTKLLMWFSSLFPSALACLWWEQVDSNPNKIAYVVFVTFSLGACAPLVGTSGLEPPTSRLSGVCSNQLSYVPKFILALTLRVQIHKTALTVWWR